MTCKTFYRHVVDAIEGMYGAYQAFGVIKCGDKVLSSASVVAEPTFPGRNQQIRVSLKSNELWHGAWREGPFHASILTQDVSHDGL